MATILLQTSSQLEVCTQSYGHPKSQESQLWEFRDSHLGVSGQNDIWVLVMWSGIEYTIRGKVVASPKSRLWWVLWVCGCLCFVHAPKCSNYTLTNLLFGLCRFVWVNELLVNLPSPIPELQHAPLPPEVLRTKECAPTPSPSDVFTFGLSVESIKELGGASQNRNYVCS
jgi:hypothetical protein